MSTVIDQAVQARLIATAPRSRTIPAALRYDRADPYAVRVVFPPAASLDGAEVEWTFGRELLQEGLRQSSGAGDVTVRPHDPDTTVIEFHTADGTARVHFDARDLLRFLACSYGLVARGGEGRHLDVDGDLAALLREA
ncbi:SsgA family sporulation/cell division regulator [Streptomyces sp. NPDC101393]|uniref:SsgA family sporulation/cell division regulator n=1 Tax=Streptomyces sp. NPDC101393 TaxID=3366141 RepID=UPI0037F593E3